MDDKKIFGEDFEKAVVIVRTLINRNGRKQYILKFDNGFGISIVPLVVGCTKDDKLALWETVVVKFDKTLEYVMITVPSISEYMVMYPNYDKLIRILHQVKSLDEEDYNLLGIDIAYTGEVK